MPEPQEIIEKALQEGRTTLSEYESKLILSHYHIPVTREKLCTDMEDLRKAAMDFGYPLVLKGNSPEITHKTEKDLIRLDIRNEQEAETAFQEIMDHMNDKTGTVLVQEMLKGKRELLAGLTRDPQFGPCVLFGLGGIFTEILEDVSFRIAPLDRKQALEMMQETKAWKMLDAIRGMAAVDKDLLADILIRIGQIGLEIEAIKEIDINPLIVSGNRPIAVDALIVLAP
ncbi:MAG: acetate--CoA ligase family protein [Deltaproteobacteria bacterium]|nr:acetate--CoA ligase family protein [Deltaproteobacteria bacterium]